MCRKAGEVGLIATPLNPEATPWKPIANPVLHTRATKKLVNYYYPHYHFHYPAAAGLMHQYPPPLAHPNYYHDQKKPLKEVSMYNVQCQPNPDWETTQKDYPRCRGKWMLGGCGYARKIGGGGHAKEVIAYDCTMGLRSAGSNKARWSRYNKKTQFDMPKNRGRGIVCGNGRGQYVPKKMTHRSNGGDVHVVSAGTALAVDEGDAGGVKRTTVMIRNIPNKFRRGMLMCFLDKYCLELNLEYDFVYLPMDFKTLDNFGYAFVNFTSASAATKIMNTLSNYKWGLVPSSDGTLVECKKICQVTWANSQGKEDLARRFMNTFFSCASYDFLPVMLTPPRNGSNSDSVTVTPVGKCRQLLLA